MTVVSALEGFIGLDEAFEAIRFSDRGDFWIDDPKEHPRINPRFLEGKPDDCGPQTWAAFRHAEETGEGPLIRAIKDGALPIYDTDGRRLLPRTFRMRLDLDWHRVLVTGELPAGESGEPLPLFVEANVIRGWLRGLRDGQRPSPGRGAKPKYDWSTFEVEVRRLLADEGGISPAVDPGFRQSDVERHMAEWCERNWGMSPAESSIRTHVVEAIRKADNSPN